MCRASFIIISKLFLPESIISKQMREKLRLQVSHVKRCLVADGELPCSLTLVANDALFLYVPYILIDKSILQIMIFCKKKKVKKWKICLNLRIFATKSIDQNVNKTCYDSVSSYSIPISLLASMVSLASHALYVSRLNMPLLDIDQSSSTT